MSYAATKNVTAFRQSSGNVEAMLREQVDLLTEQLRQIKKALMPRLLFPLEWELNRGETSILASLYASPDGFRSKEILRTAAEIFCASEDGPADSTVSVRVSAINKKLRPRGIEVSNRHSEGYYLSKDARARVKRALDSEA